MDNGTTAQWINAWAPSGRSKIWRWSVIGRGAGSRLLGSFVRAPASGLLTLTATDNGTTAQWINASAPSGRSKIWRWSVIGRGAGSRLLGSFVRAPASGFLTLTATDNGTTAQWINASAPSGSQVIFLSLATGTTW